MVIVREEEDYPKCWDEIRCHDTIKTPSTGTNGKHTMAISEIL